MYRFELVIRVRKGVAMCTKCRSWVVKEDLIALRLCADRICLLTGRSTEGFRSHGGEVEESRKK